jgi:hypothetical protein
VRKNNTWSDPQTLQVFNYSRHTFIHSVHCTQTYILPITALSNAHKGHYMNSGTLFDKLQAVSKKFPIRLLGTRFTNAISCFNPGPQDNCWHLVIGNNLGTPRPKTLTLSYRLFKYRWTYRYHNNLSWKVFNNSNMSVDLYKTSLYKVTQ